MKVAAIQLNSQDSVEQNLVEAERQVSAASDVGAELVVLPEAFAYLGPDSGKAAIAESLEEDGAVVAAMKRIARSQKIHLVAGGIIERSPDPQRPFNTSAVFGPEGQLIGKYRKMHLFDVELEDGTSWHESRATRPGEAPVVTHVAGWNIGLSICYDLRFPELFAWQRAHGASLLTIPSAFTKTTGEAHWHVLLRARAIETQCWVVAAAQEGSHPRGRQTYGHALIVDPWGRIVAERTSRGPGFIVATIDQDSVRSTRRQMPVEDHRRDFPSD